MGSDTEPVDAERVEPLSASERERFLAYIAENQGCSIKEASVAIGRKRKELKALIRTDEEFGADYRAARGYDDDTIRAEIHRRAITGVEEPVFGSLGGGAGSGQIGVVRKFSDRLLAKMAEAYLPEYQQRGRLELSGPDGGPIELERRIVVGISDVVRLAGELGISLPLGVNGGDPGRELPPAQDVLPDPPAR